MDWPISPPIIPASCLEMARPNPVPPYLRVIEEPLLRLVSVDLGATTDITNLAEVFDFAKDYLGLLKAAVIAAGHRRRIDVGKLAFVATDGTPATPMLVSSATITTNACWAKESSTPNA